MDKREVACKEFDSTKVATLKTRHLLFACYFQGHMKISIFIKNDEFISNSERNSTQVLSYISST